MDNLNDSAFGGNFCTSLPVLAIATTTSQYKTTAAANYCIDGRSATKAATDNNAFTAGHTTLQNSQVCCVGVYLNASGTFSTVQGPIISVTDLANGVTALRMPPAQADKCMIGYIRIATNASSTFIFGTTALNAANVTTTYQDTMFIPTKNLYS